MTYKTSLNYEVVFRHIYSFYVEPLVSFTYSVDQLLGKMKILLKQISKKLISIYSICMVSVPVNVDTYLENRHEYMQVHVQYHYISMSTDFLYVSSTEPLLKLCV